MTPASGNRLEVDRDPFFLPVAIAGRVGALLLAGRRRRVGAGRGLRNRRRRAEMIGRENMGGALHRPDMAMGGVDAKH